MKKNKFDEARPELIQMIENWIATRNILGPGERLSVVLEIQPMQTVEVNLKIPLSSDLPEDLAERCAVKIEDLQLQRVFEKYVSAFITLGQLTRYSENDLLGYRVPGSYHHSIGHITIKHIKELLANTGLQFNSNQPMSEKERNVILDASSYSILKWPVGILAEEFKTVRSLVEAEQAHLEKQAQHLLEEVRSRHPDTWKEITVKKILEDLDAVLSEFSLSLKQEITAPI